MSSKKRRKKIKKTLQDKKSTKNTKSVRKEQKSFFVKTYQKIINSPKKIWHISTKVFVLVTSVVGLATINIVSEVYNFVKKLFLNLKKAVLSLKAKIKKLLTSIHLPKIKFKKLKIFQKSSKPVTGKVKYAALKTARKKVRSKKFKTIKKKKYKKKVNKVMLFFLGVSWIVVAGVIIGMFFYLKQRNSEIPTPDKVFPEVGLATEIYDRNGVRLYRLYNDESNNDRVDIEEINDLVKASFMAAEDSQFYNHRGFDPQAMLRCAINILQKEKECGASTITQQLIKITTKQNQLTLDRKISEILLAAKVENNYEKDQIFEMYLRVTPYGSNITGIKTAAKFYFGVEDLKKLTLAQAVTLAAIVNNPARLSPTVSSNREESLKALEERKAYIFDQLSIKMKEINEQLRKNNNDPEADDVITQELIDEARNEKLTYKHPVFTDMKAGHFVNYALEVLRERNYKNGTEPFTLTDLQTGGYRIYTSLDYDIQRVAEGYVEQAGNQYKIWNMHNAALVTVKPDTGEVIAMVGSKNFNGQSEGCDANNQNCLFNPEVNILTTLQSPGSTNKVVGYYEAFRQGRLFPGSFLPDIPIKLGDYEPKNWDGKFYGIYHTAREMLRESRNIPAIQVINMIGVDRYLDVEKEFGYTTYKNNQIYGPSVILGGADVLPIEHVQAFGVFANGGDLVEVNPILKIVDRYDNVIYEAKPQRKRVADPAAVWQVNQTLFRLDSLGSPIAWDDRQLAGKTGTSEDNKDVLVVLWSPDFVTLGWGGNNNNAPLDPYNGWPGNVVTPWVKAFMKDIGESPYFSAKTPFTQPDNVYYGGGDCDYQGQCIGIAKDWLIAGREPKGDVVAYWADGTWRYRYVRMPSPELQYFLDRYYSLGF